MDYTLRPAEPRDMYTLIRLCAAHAEYERADYDPTEKQENLAKHLFQENPPLYCIVAEAESQVVGYATYMRQYSTWDAAYYLYMDCIYLFEEYRNYGIGAEMMKYIQKEAKRLECTHIQWQTPDFNTDAIRFYKRIGGISKDKERFFWHI